ncbi:hypothetical protein N7474_006283 [Penicillium riverlandense]|uniref:uncharacterized protein n=1 Tax=Penicillium riverlandense TaxID=1903569 RepID=UPI0025489EF0|nr:uncharacterized protein N7474_006283 [Penicillium riverlandense]KAJ5814506.1 hypothetical protein N7474_006283 [Penicillium riverlandense]
MNEIRGQYKRSPDKTEAWILGSGTASLASALYLVQFAKVPASKVHVLDSHISMGQVLHNSGDPTNGYDQFAACLPVPVGTPLAELLALVPSVSGLGHTVWDDIKSAETRRVKQRNSRTRFLVQKNDALNDIHTNSLHLSVQHRLELIMLVLRGEKRLGRAQIQDFLPPSFFQSTFWTIWTAQFGFQPWHSAIEFRRALRQHIDGFHSLSLLSCLDLTGYYQNESIYLPTFLHLERLGVDFHFDTKITNIETTIKDGQETVSQLDMIQNGFKMQQTISRDDVVIMTLGSTVSGVTRGTNDRPPGRHSLEPHDELDESWSLWLEIGSRSDVFGNPYNFCTRESESLLESFTITTADPSLIEYVDLHAHNVTEAGTFISFQESSWKLSCCIPTQPVFSQQPKTIRIFWGFALLPKRPGNYVKKPMYDCSGAEITKEVLGHLHFSSPTLRTMTIPRVMPRMSAMLLIRSLGDRPPVIPQNISNLGLVGQFAEIPHFSCVDTSYSVRTAQVAVSQLMGIDVQYVKEKKPSILDLLRSLLWK